MEAKKVEKTENRMTEKEIQQNKEGIIKGGSVSAEELQAEYKKKINPVKPVTVRLDDFRKNLNQVVADSELPPFLLELTLGEMLSAMSGVARQEREQDREAWEQACKEGEENG